MNTIRRAIWNYVLGKAEKAGFEPPQHSTNEQDRLNEIESLDLVQQDLEKDQKFSSLPRLAAYLTQCPQAMIHIIDRNTQYCKMEFGKKSSLAYISREMPRALSTCQYVLNNNCEPIVIEDCSLDERTKLIFEAGGGMAPKFYAGSPIVSKNGFILGTICVLDDDPRSLNHEQLDGMRLLADQFVELLETPSDYQTDTSAQENEKMEGQYISSATILFADFVGFTKKTEEVQPGELLEILNSFFDGFDKIMERFGLTKVKTIGDAYMAVGGVPDKNSNHAVEVCNAAMEMMKYVQGAGVQQEALGQDAWQLRIGINTGPVIAGHAGDHFDIWGDAVNLAARLESSGEAGKIQISEKTKQFLPENAKTEFQEKVSLKNKGEVDTYFMIGL